MWLTLLSCGPLPIIFIEGWIVKLLVEYGGHFLWPCCSNSSKQSRYHQPNQNIHVIQHMLKHKANVSHNEKNIMSKRLVIVLMFQSASIYKLQLRTNKLMPLPHGKPFQQQKQNTNPFSIARVGCTQVSLGCATPSRITNIINGFIPCYFQNSW